MSHPLADLQSTLGGWLIVALLAPGLLVLVGIVLAFVFARPRRGEPPAATPGYFHLMGIDGATGAPREATIHAESREAAMGRAQLNGMVVTEIRQVDGSAE